MQYTVAYDLSKYFLKCLSPACLRIETVGSVKRADPKAVNKGVHDLEFLLIADPDTVHTDSNWQAVFGVSLEKPMTKLERLILDLKDDGIISTPKYVRKAEGDKFKKFAIVGKEYEDADGVHDFCLELYIVTARTWALQNVIRTGPSAFSQRFVTNESATCFHRASNKSYRGLLPDAYQYVEGETVIKRRSTGETLDLTEERDAIWLLGLRENEDFWIPPEERYLYT